MIAIILILAAAFAVYHFISKRKLKTLIDSLTLKKAEVDSELESSKKKMINLTFDLNKALQEKRTLEQSPAETIYVNTPPTKLTIEAVAAWMELENWNLKNENGAKLPYFEFYKDKDKTYRWHLKAKNNRIIAESGEGYNTKQNLKKAVFTMLDTLKSDDFGSKWI